MSNEFHFGLGDGHLPQRVAKIAQKHGATLVNYTDAQCKCGYGCRPHSCKASRRHWFAASNRGEPFNSRLAEAVLAEI